MCYEGTKYSLFHIYIYSMIQMCLVLLLADLVCKVADTGNSDASGQNISTWYNIPLFSKGYLKF